MFLFMIQIIHKILNKNNQNFEGQDKQNHDNNRIYY